jgi:hypothetical protein
MDARERRNCMSEGRMEIRENGEPRYQSYLLRLWQEGSGEEKRALLQDVVSGESRSFASLGSLFDHLRRSPGQQEGKEKDGPR